MPEPVDGDLDDLLAYLDDARGFDFTGYKRPSLSRRISKRMHDVGVGDLRAYRDLLEAQPSEFVDLFNTILINVTGFMRDAESWKFLREQIVPSMVAGKGHEDPIRVWSAGCSTGEEAYSLAMVLCEALGQERYRQTVKIYGTDADADALAQARQARYDRDALEAALDPDTIERYFEPNEHGLVFRGDLRRAVIFGRHDLVQDPPISRIDLLVCRNTLMYFNASTQRDILSSFHFALNDGGYLFLGKSEALVTRTNLFEVADLKHRMFRKDGRRARPAASSATDDRGRAPSAITLEGLLEASFEASATAQLVVDREGLLVLANRQARSLFGIGLHQLGRPFRDLELSYRPVELRSMIDEVIDDRRPVALSDVQITLPNGSIEYLDLSVAPLGGHTLTGVLLSFAQVTRYRQLRDDLERSQRDLELAYEELQSTVEELETTNEELQSTNEELETTNEELHSTNEELETMNEELQSTNEEFETINGELRQRTIELDDLSSFLQAILASLDVGVIVLSEHMAVRAWNREAADQWGVRADEAVGQHIMNLDIGLPIDQLVPSIRSSIAGHTSEAQHQQLVAVNRRGRRVDCGVTITPLSVDGERPSGAILLVETRPTATAERDGSSS